MRSADFGAAFPSVQQNVEVPRHIAQIVEQGRSRWIEGRKNQTLITAQLSHRNESPLLAVEPGEGFRHRHNREFAFAAVGPAVI